MVTNCTDSGDLAGFCSFSGIVGEVFRHDSSFTQNMASVTAVVDLGDGQRVTMTGTISVEGELQLNSGQVVPADPDFNAQAENWRSRADTPSRMTGIYDLVLTVPGLSGSARMNLRLDNVAKISASAAAADRGASLGSKLRSRIRSRVPNRH